uniref:Uncharacterized protein n=1 Tax=Clytia hemisphaerica TaxID=252671 RepID=A0A7M5XNR3_9CNID
GILFNMHFYKKTNKQSSLNQIHCSNKSSTLKRFERQNKKTSMFLAIQLFVLSAFVYFTASNGVVQNFQDFSMLSCSQFRNITFINNNQKMGVYDNTFDHHFFMQGLNDLLDNEACFMVNYFNGFDIVRLRKNYNINQFQFGTKNFHFYDNPSRYLDERPRIAELMKQLYDEKIMGNDVNIKQTLVLIINNIINAVDILKNLELLQNERQWTIIVFRIDSSYSPIDWLPLNRNIQTKVAFGNSFSLQHPVFKTLFDVIKNPDYDVYDMSYRLVMSKKNLFTDDCMKDIRNIIVTVGQMKFTYTPMASAILRKVNAQRSKVKQDPLEIHFSTPDRGIMPSSDGNLTLTKFKWENHPLYRPRKEKNKNHVYIRIFTGNKYRCQGFIERQDFYYRYFLSNWSEECFHHVNAKTFGTGEELFEHINDDLCKN